ncbi:MAG: hypothetical protein MUE95_02385 [Cyclobacteriaceae bacterium]|nr:hypothetical protein [Cyclobacteriaceae bacterium]
MTSEDILQLMAHGNFPKPCVKPELIETHISWVIICGDDVYKIKKPIRYPFLDFSTIEKRRHFCERELQLNQRLTRSMYLDVVPVFIESNIYHVGEGSGQPVEYAVHMRSMDRSRQMDVLLRQAQVTPAHIIALADQIVSFHQRAVVLRQSNPLLVGEQFNGLLDVQDIVRRFLGADTFHQIHQAVAWSDQFMEQHRLMLLQRSKEGFIRDVHGDLHSRNIFLLEEPVVFDCIEFNDSFRQIDVLNEVAFLCMDLDAYGREDLSRLFINHYNNLFPVIRSQEEQLLFSYFKAYRANVRAKVNALRAASTEDNAARAVAMNESVRYFNLLNAYAGAA